MCVEHEIKAICKVCGGDIPLRIERASVCRIARRMDSHNPFGKCQSVSRAGKRVGEYYFCNDENCRNMRHQLRLRGDPRIYCAPFEPLYDTPLWRRERDRFCR